jgi:hypothetical protein
VGAIVPVWVSAVAAEHYGVRTRALDWTWNSLVAAYFASDPTQSATQASAGDAMAVWALSTACGTSFHECN